MPRVSEAEAGQAPPVVMESEVGSFRKKSPIQLGVCSENGSDNPMGRRWCLSSQCVVVKYVLSGVNGKTKKNNHFSRNVLKIKKRYLFPHLHFYNNEQNNWPDCQGLSLQKSKYVIEGSEVTQRNADGTVGWPTGRTSQVERSRRRANAAAMSAGISAHGQGRRLMMVW